MSKTVTISEVEYKALLRDQKWLNCLEAAGVDNWEGYEYAAEMLPEDDEE